MASSFAENLLRTIEEKKKHNPFKNRGTIGPATYGGWVRKGQPFFGGKKMATTPESGGYDCSCANYRCTCTGEDGRKIVVRIDRAYKKQYNKDYRKWQATQKQAKGKGVKKKFAA